MRSNSALKLKLAKYHQSVTVFVIVLSVVMLLFSVAIVFQIFNITVNKHAHYNNVVKNARQVSYSLAPRGKIYDRNGVLLVGNAEDNIIQYYPLTSLSTDEKWKLAQKFAKDFNVSAKLTLRQEKDLFIFLNNNSIIKSKFSSEELKSLTKKEIDNQLIQRITDEDLKVLTDELKNAFHVKMQMDYATENRFGIVKRQVTQQEVSKLLDNKASYPGFVVDFDWKRIYLKDDLFKSVLGRVSNEVQGLPSEESQYLLSMGYQLNDRVGLSGIEKQYESYLRGEPNVYEIVKDESNNISKNYLKEGNAGNDLYLTIDVRLQQQLNQILASALQKQKSRSDKLQHAMVSIMDVDTGEVLGLASQTFTDDKNAAYDSASLTYLHGFTPGSSVKGATIYMGLDTGVIRPGEVIYDTPLYFRDSPPKRSFANYGNISDLDALRVSSNVYMFHIAMRLGGMKSYTPHQVLNVRDDTINDIRKYFTAFGLGALTELDVPNEQLAYIGHAMYKNHALDYVIGQYDQYTLIQLNQYANTLATKGQRLKPYLVKKIMNHQEVLFDNQKQLLGVVPGNHAYFERVHTGLALTGHRFKGYELAFKTGTAEVDNNYITNTVISFGPKNNPKISIACAVPHSNNVDTVSFVSNPCVSIVKEVYQAYDALYPLDKK